MTPEEINIAIAEFCGWSDIRAGKLYTFDTYGKSPDLEIGRTKLPDFYHDLNAVHEAEKMLKGSKDDEHSELSGTTERKPSRATETESK